MNLEKWLRGRVLWLVLPVARSNALLALMLLAWAWSTPSLVGASQTTLFGNAALALATLCQLVVLVAGYLAPTTFRALAAGRLSPSPGHRLASLGELRRLPARVASANASGWLFFAIALALFALFQCDAPFSSALRIGVGALIGGGLSTVLLSLTVTARTWLAFDVLSEGLAPGDVSAHAPPVDWSVRRRTVLFAIVLTVGPLVLLTDVALQLLEQAPSVLRVANVEAHGQLVDELVADALVRLGVLAALSMLFAGLTAAAAGWTIAEPMRRLSEDAGRVMRGSIGRPRVIAADGEVWRVTWVFAKLCERLALLIEKVVDAGLQLRTATESLQQTTSRSEATATDQAAALNETSATTEELARRTLVAAQEGRADAAAFQSAVDRMKQDNRSIAGAVERLQRRVQQIGRIVELINTVADRSDLLALSAELEGGRAGEVGRGFSLVGSEMRRLAENVLESTGEVDALIAEIREATVRTAEATDRGSALTVHGTALADAVTATLARVAELADATASQVRTITLSTQQQQSGTDQLAESMAEILRSTRGELDATRGVAELNQHLVVLAESLSKVVTRFTGAGA